MTKNHDLDITDIQREIHQYISDNFPCLCVGCPKMSFIIPDINLTKEEWEGLQQEISTMSQEERHAALDLETITKIISEFGNTYPIIFISNTVSITFSKRTVNLDFADPQFFAYLDAELAKILQIIRDGQRSC